MIPRYAFEVKLVIIMSMSAKDGFCRLRPLKRSSTSYQLFRPLILRVVVHVNDREGFYPAALSELLLSHTMFSRGSLSGAHASYWGRNSCPGTSILYIES